MLYPSCIAKLYRYCTLHTVHFTSDIKVQYIWCGLHASVPHRCSSWIWTSRPLHMARIVHQSAGFSTIQCRCYITSYPVSHWNLILALHHLQVQVFSNGRLNCQNSNQYRYKSGTNSLIRSNTILHLKAISYDLTFCRSAIENEVWRAIENEVWNDIENEIWWGEQQRITCVLRLHQ